MSAGPREQRHASHDPPVPVGVDAGGSDGHERVEEMLRWLRAFAERTPFSMMDDRRAFSPSVILELGRRGFFAVAVPSEHGGAPMSVREQLRITEQLAAIDLTLASLFGVHLALGTRPIVRYGSSESKERYLPALARGQMLAGLALTEPAAGSDPRQLEASATPIAGGAFILRGEKRWIGNAAWASVINVFARTGELDGRATIAGFTVPTDAPGVRQGAETPTLGMRAMVQNTLHLDGVRVPGHARLGATHDGLAPLTDTLRFGRLGVAAMSLGAMQRATQLALRYASRRTVSSGRMLDHPMVRARFGFARGAIELARAVVTHTGARLDRGLEDLPEAHYLAMKIVIPELLFEVVDGSLQMLGGRGYVEGNGLAQMFRDARLLRIFEGPTEALTHHLGMLAMVDALDTGLLFGRAATRSQESTSHADLAGELRAMLETARRASRVSDHPLAMRRARTLEVAYAVGDWLAYALLETICLRTASLPGLELAARRREDASQRAWRVIQGWDVPPAKDDVRGYVAGLEAHIGDVEASSTFIERTIDPLLMREPPPGV